MVWKIRDGGLRGMQLIGYDDQRAYSVFIDRDIGDEWFLLELIYAMNKIEERLVPTLDHMNH